MKDWKPISRTLKLDDIKPGATLYTAQGDRFRVTEVKHELATGEYLPCDGTDGRPARAHLTRLLHSLWFAVEDQP